jgi:hypothetical protein
MKNKIVNIPECYQDYITVRQGCENITPKSGLYIEDLPGISIQSAAMIAEEKYRNGVDLIHDKVIHAIQLLESSVQRHIMLQGYNIPPAPKTREICSFSKTQVNGTAGLERGIRLYQNNLTSPYSCLFVNRIYIKSQTTATKTLKVQDKDGNLITSYSVDLVANELYTLEANLCVYNTQTFILLDNIDIVTYKTTCWNGDCCHWDYSKRASRFYSVNGWNGTNCDRNGYGIGVDIGLRCDLSAMMCDVLPYIKMAVLYKAGSEILKELMASRRLSIVTISNQEWAEETIPQWEAFVEDELETIIPTLLPTLKDNDTNCLTCLQFNTKKHSIV